MLVCTNLSSRQNTHSSFIFPFPPLFLRLPAVLCPNPPRSLQLNLKSFLLPNKTPSFCLSCSSFLCNCYRPCLHLAFIFFLYFPPASPCDLLSVPSYFFFFVHIFLSADCQFEVGGWDGIIRSSQVEEEERVKPGDALDCIWTIRAPPQSKVSSKGCISQTPVMMADTASVLLRDSPLSPFASSLSNIFSFSMLFRKEQKMFHHSMPPAGLKKLPPHMQLQEVGRYWDKNCYWFFCQEVQRYFFGGKKCKELRWGKTRKRKTFKIA